ncbi:MAG TPA: TolC family protein [Thiobacillus sp.]|nr:TolC family protein [Thiobacillus sp.]HQT69392.1 TolC family protein [Thiobacillus sp.]
MIAVHPSGMANSVRTLSLALAWAFATLSFSAPAQADYLPDPVAAEAALWASPSVAQARGNFAAQSLRSQSLQQGSAEWRLDAEAGQRRIQTMPSANQAEWGLALSRPIRMPARTEADRALAGALTAHAEASLGEALHESGRQLLMLWFDWLNASSQSHLWQAQYQLAEQQLATVNARIRLGEAPRAERVNTEAALAQVRLQQQQASTRAQQARNRLQAQFPGVGVSADVSLPAPRLPEGTAERYVETVLAHNHELFRARRQADVLQAEARQLAKLRSADPTLGVFYKNEAGGNEHVVGLGVGLTLPGGARRTNQLAAEQLGTTARDAAVQLEQRLRVDARADFEAATAQVENWQQADRAARALAEAARLAARGYELGEGSLDQVLLNRRLALEGQLMAQQTQLDALAANARLKLDSHLLWPLDVETDSAHAHP